MRVQLGLLQRFILLLTGRVYTGHKRHPGWSGALPHYAISCPVHGVVESHGSGVDYQAPADGAAERESAGAAHARIVEITGGYGGRSARAGGGADRLDLAARAVAPVNETARNQRLRGAEVVRHAVRLPSLTRSGAEGTRGEGIGLQAEPVEILEQGRLVFGPAPLPVVILDPQ